VAPGAVVVVVFVAIALPGALACLPPAQQFRGRVRHQMTCPAKAYQVEVEGTACVVQLRPVWPAFFVLNGLK
jgi:hypothetical protein